MTELEFKSLKAKVLVQESLLKALLWKDAMKQELLFAFGQQQAGVMQSLNKEPEPDRELITLVESEFRLVSAQLPRGN